MTAAGGGITLLRNSECDNEDNSDGACVNGTCLEAGETFRNGAGAEATGSSRLRFSLILIGFFEPSDGCAAVDAGGATDNDGPLWAGTAAGATEETWPTEFKGVGCFFILIFISVAAALAPNCDNHAYITHSPKHMSGSESEKWQSIAALTTCRGLC